VLLGITMGYKFDYPPLLAPGRHYLSLAEICALCMSPFPGNPVRKRLCRALEEFVSAFIAENISCDMLVDGSFLTEHPSPNDVDVAVELDVQLSESLSTSQRRLVNAVNGGEYIDGIDGFVYVLYPRGHELFGYERVLGGFLDDGMTWAESYQMQHSGTWLKGVAVCRVLETDVGLRIRC
jgi:hypothetical protein